MPATGLVAAWDFLGAGQELQDLSGNAHVAQLGSAAGADANDPEWAAEGMAFDRLTYPSAQYLVVPHDAALNVGPTWTVSAVVRLDTEGLSWFAVKPGLDAGAKYSPFSVARSGGLYPGRYGVTLGTGTTAVEAWEPTDDKTPLGQWVHLTGRVDGTNIELYRNGTLLDQTAQGINVPGDNLGYMLIGVGSDWSTDHGTSLGGTIAYLALYDGTDVSIADEHAWVKCWLGARGIVLGDS